MDFAGMIKTWISVLTRPGEEVFEEERVSERANFSTTIIWIVIAALITAVFGAISLMIASALGSFDAIMQDMPPEIAGQMAPLLAGGIGLAGFTFCLTLILRPIIFFVNSLIVFAVAKMLGGTGDYENQSYLLSTYTAPLWIVGSLISIIPLLGSCVAFLIMIYQFVLSYFALKVAHNLTSGKAIVAALSPVLLIFLVFCCLIGLGAALGGVAGSSGF